MSAFLATVVSVVLSLPQVWRTLVQGRTGGLALSHVWFAVVMAATWVQYGLQSGAVGAAVNSALGGVLNGLVLLGLARAMPHVVCRQATVVLPVAALWLGLHAHLLASGRVVLVGTLTAVASVVAALPQVVLMLRRPDLDLSGISALTWRLGAVANLCWVAYWSLRGEAVLVLPALAGLLAAAVVLAILAGARAGRPHPAERFARRRSVVRRTTASHAGTRVVVPGSPAPAAHAGGPTAGRRRSGPARSVAHPSTRRPGSPRPSLTPPTRRHARAH